MDVRKTVAIGAAVVVAVLAVVSASALTSPVAWAAAAVGVVVTAVVVFVVTPSPGLQRILIGIGALVALLGIVVAIAELAVRGYRTDSTATLLGLTVGIGGLLVVMGFAAGRRAPSPALLSTGALALAVIGLVAGIVVAASVPFLPLSRAVSYTAADAATEITLTTPGGVEEGDVLVAQVLRSGAGEIRPPAGWNLLRTTALPGGSGSVSLFTTTAETEGGGPVTFSVDTPATLLGGVGGWSHIASVSTPGEATGNGGAVTVAPAPDDSASQVLYFVAGSGVADVPASDPLTDAWTVKADNVIKATTALVTRPALAEDAAAPVSITPTAPFAAWASQTVVLEAQ